MNGDYVIREAKLAFSQGGDVYLDRDPRAVSDQIDSVNHTNCPSVRPVTRKRPSGEVCALLLQLLIYRLDLPSSRYFFLFYLSCFAFPSSKSIAFIWTPIAVSSILLTATVMGLIFV